MKGKIYTWLAAMALGILLPGVMFSVAEKLTITEDYVPQASVTTDPIKQEDGIKITVLQSDGTVEKMLLDDYITGVVLGEMPLSFDIEALKAQAVVARTYALNRLDGNKKHPSASVCTASACCQAYRTKEAYLASGGTEPFVEKAVLAVKATAGEALYYEGDLIEATYFSCSGGRTEDAKAVWGTDIPYLQALDSPGEEEAVHYIDTIQFSVNEFVQLLNINLEEPLIGAVTYTDGGGVNTMEIAGEIFDGVTLRQKLGLRSTAFDAVKVGSTIYITTRGFGHRVGMSQYGAEAMAVKGDSYKEILSYYYPGTNLSVYSRN